MTTDVFIDFFFFTKIHISGLVLMKLKMKTKMLGKHWF